MRMTEREWLAGADLQAMFQRVWQSGLGSTRKRLLFAAACLHRIWPILLYKGSREAVEVLERFADGLASEDERAAGTLLATGACDTATRDREMADPYASSARVIRAAAVAALAAREAIENRCPDHTGQFVAQYAAEAQAAWEEKAAVPWATSTQEQEAQASLLRDLFGPLPFRLLAPLHEDIVAWNNGVVVRLALEIYDERAFDRLIVLAGAHFILQKSIGRSAKEICRSLGPLLLLRVFAKNSRRGAKSFSGSRTMAIQVAFLGIMRERPNQNSWHPFFKIYDRARGPLERFGESLPGQVGAGRGRCPLIPLGDGEGSRTCRPRPPPPGNFRHRVNK
jgi:hypothetical protein